MWAARTTLQLGDIYVGVRSSSAELDSWIRTALAAHVVDEPAPPNYSLVAPGSTPTAGGHPAGVGLLYRSHVLRVRTRSRARLGHAFVRALAAHLPVSRPDGLVAVDALAAVRDGAAVVVVDRDRAVAPELLDRALHAHGAPLADEPVLLVDPHHGELVVAPVPFGDGPVTLPVDEPAGGHDEPPPVGVGRYPIAGWVTLARDGTSPAAQLGGALHELRDGQPWLALRPASPRDLATAIAGLLDRRT